MYELFSFLIYLKTMQSSFKVVWRRQTQPRTIIIYNENIMFLFPHAWTDCCIGGFTAGCMNKKELK